MAAETTSEAIIDWSDDALTLAIDVDPAGIARLIRLASPGVFTAPADDRDRGGFSAVPAENPPRIGATPTGLPLVDVVLAGEGRSWSGHRYCESVAGARLVYAGHEEEAGDTAPGGRWRRLRVDLDDPVTGLRAEVFFRVLDGQGVLRSWVRLINRGPGDVTVESVTSFLCGDLASGAPAGGTSGGGPDDLESLDVLWAENDWLAEGRWRRRGLRDALPDLNRQAHGGDPRGMFGLTSTGTWSSGTYLPMGAVLNRRTGHAWAWQIEHNGAWHWQVGEAVRREPPPPGTVVGHGPTGPRRSGAYLALLGPADNEHHWRITLAPGQAFTSVPVAVAASADGFDGAVAGLTACRRAIRRPHDDHRRLPLIFNDYMNTLMGNPTTGRLLPLIEAAAAVGAEYFVIDAGWYAELDEGWWDTVGVWRPSQDRFPGGLAEVLDRIRAAGMVPGLWLEPEVVGVRSPVADRLPAEAFFSRGGQRVVEHGRYHLDLRHPAAVKHLDETIDFLVGDLGVGYLKLDYNINGGPGTDIGRLSAGAGLLGHNRAHLDWLDAVLDRHPGLVIENCASGGGRSDYALLARLQLQSTSDQQDFLRYAAIAAAAPAGLTPEQAAVWAYPQPDFSDDEIAFALCSALLGRVHLSGHIDRMSEPQRRLVAEAVGVYQAIRPDLAQAFPFWPLGLPRWPDPWLALGMRAPSATYLLAWHRDRLGAADPAGSAGQRGPAGQAAEFSEIEGASEIQEANEVQKTGEVAKAGEARAASEPDRVTLAVRHLHGQAVTAEILYPAGGPAGRAVSWDADRGELTVALPTRPSACLVRLA